jgi:SAM-dependent methyltransferase
MQAKSDPPEGDAIEARERAFFAKYYGGQEYNATAWRLRMERELRSLLREKGSASLGKVLSVGCGDGRFESMVARHADRVLGIDLSPEAIDLAQRLSRAANVPNVEFRCASAREFDTEERFDTVLCIAFLHHVPEAELADFMAWLAARVAPGGLLYTQDPNIHGVLRKIGRIVLGARYDAYHSPDERELDPHELEGMFRRAGFEDVRTAGIDLTILPVGYMLARGPGWPMLLFSWLDRIWCATPLERWASGFKAVGRKPA